MDYFWEIKNNISEIGLKSMAILSNKIKIIDSLKCPNNQTYSKTHYYEKNQCIYDKFSKY